MNCIISNNTTHRAQIKLNAWLIWTVAEVGGVFQKLNQICIYGEK
jgi:hypothetical protein